MGRHNPTTSINLKGHLNGHSEGRPNEKTTKIILASNHPSLDKESLQMLLSSTHFNLNGQICLKSEAIVENHCNMIHKKSIKKVIKNMFSCMHAKYHIAQG